MGSEVGYHMLGGQWGKLICLGWAVRLASICWLGSAPTRNLDVMHCKYVGTW